MAKADGRESNVYCVRVLGEFPTSEDDAFIPFPVIEAAIANVLIISGEITFGVVVARY